MRYVLTVLLPILLMGSVMGGEPERKARVQALIEQLADESIANRQAAYDELRDTVVRKRDIPELTKEIARNDNPEVKRSLQTLITFMEKRCRLPDKGWADDYYDASTPYEKAFDALGCFGLVSKTEWLLPSLDVWDVPIGPEKMRGAINLILTVEPEVLYLGDAWTDISFLGVLTDLKELTLCGTRVTDLTPLQGFPGLYWLALANTKVFDLTPLKGMPSLRYLGLQNTKVADLTPLKGLPGLESLYLQNTKVTDLTPLKGLANLDSLHLENTAVADLMPLKGLPRLKELYLENTQVTDLTPLKGMPSLRYLYLQNSKVTDLTPLIGMPELRIVPRPPPEQNSRQSPDEF